jgi:basic membrane protein A
VGFLIVDAMVEVATANPEANFVLIDAVAVDDNDVPLENVQSVTFKENEAAYLGGIIAGMTTEAKEIGFVGGLEIPPVIRFLTGFQAGVESVDDSISIETAYAGAFDDPATTKELTASYFDGGADVVFEVAGLGGLGAYEEATERGAGVWVMGTDTCKQQLAPDNYLTSATKDVSGAVFDAASAVADGSFAGGAVNLGLAEERVGVCQDTFGDLPQEVQDAVTEAQAAIVAGTITVPTGT